MKQLWFGALLLIGLLIAGFGTSFGVRWVQEPITAQLEQAAQAGFREDWEQADALFTAAHARWEKYRSALATISDHGPMEEIDSLFGELEFYRKAADPIQFPALCKRLSQLTQAIGEALYLNWQNLL